MAVNSAKADQILVNGRILTIDARFSEVEAVAIQAGRFIATGSNEEIRALAGPDTVTVDLQGATALPGLIDAHNHLMNTGMVLQQIQLYDCRSLAEVLGRLEARVRVAKPGEWIIGKGWDESLMAEGRHPTRADLDPVSPDNPVVLHRVWNKLVANSAALRAAGITRETPDPPADQLYAGSFERDPESGDPTGLFRDRAKDLILNAIPSVTEEERIQAIGVACRAYNQAGITGVAEPGLFADAFRAYQRARDENVLTVRTDMLIGGWGFASPEQEPGLKSWIEGFGVYGGFGDELLRLEGVKFLLDGGVGDRTARMFDPYQDEPDNVGQWVVDPDEFPHLVQWVHDRGWSMDIHTCGSAAQELAVKSFIQAQEQSPNPRLRHRVHHAYFPTQETIRLMGEHRIPALVSNPFLVNLGESFVASVGEERAAKVMPMASYLQAGVPLAGSSDSPITDFNPWLGMYAATARSTVTGRQFDTGERISREDVLRSYTIGGAYASGREGWQGSIEPGKLADVIVVDRDPLTVSDEELRDTKVMRTMLGGNWVFERPAQ